jgi:hypothetical protein
MEVVAARYWRNLWCRDTFRSTRANRHTRLRFVARPGPRRYESSATRAEHQPSGGIDEPQGRRAI